ncbi:MAG TPA: hypothetical protein VEO01_36515 [Pseudonocardiaceae bacterium]|nr:hypothetical protein [Pseudonocardiaceae bacterium]
MKPIFVAIPRGHGLILHLHSPGYRPGPKPRGIGDSAALCNYSIHGDPLVPLRDGLHLKPTGTDPRPAWRWCRSCIGHAVAIAGLDQEVLTWIATGTEKP